MSDAPRHWSFPLAMVLIGAVPVVIVVAGVLAVRALVSNGDFSEELCKPGADEVLAEVLAEVRSDVKPGAVLSTTPVSCGETSSGHALEEEWSVADTAATLDGIADALHAAGWEGSGSQAFVGDREGIYVTVIVNVRNEAGRPIVAGHEPGRILVGLVEHPRP